MENKCFENCYYYYESRCRETGEYESFCGSTDNYTKVGEICQCTEV